MYSENAQKAAVNLCNVSFRSNTMCTRSTRAHKPARLSLFNWFKRVRSDELGASKGFYEA